MAKDRPRFFEVEVRRGSLRHEILNHLLDDVEEKRIDELIKKMRADMLRYGKQRPSTTARITRGDQPTTKSRFTEAQIGGQIGATRAKEATKSVSSRVQIRDKKSSTTRDCRKAKARTGNKARKGKRGRNVQKL